MQHGRWWHRHHLTRHRVNQTLLTRHRVNLRLHGRRVRVGVADNNLHLGLLLHQYLQGLLIQTGEVGDLHLLGVLPPELRNAALPDQAVLEDGVGGHKPVVVRVKDEVSVVCCLLCVLDICRCLRHIFNGVLTGEKHPHQAGHHGADSVAHLHRHHLGAPVFLVPERVATVVGRPHRPNGRYIGIDITDGVGQVLPDNRLQFGVVHCLLGRHVGGHWHIVHVHTGIFLSTTYILSTARGVRSNSSSPNSRVFPYSDSL